MLGIVEGLTEFLPVSSTAHLRITEALMKIPLDDAYWKMYTIVIQAGAILALLLLYLGRILEFLRTFPRGERGDRNLAYPSAIADHHCLHLHVDSGAAVEEVERQEPGKPHRDRDGAAAGGVIMWAVDAWSSRYEPNTIHVEEMTLGQAVWIGTVPIALGNLSGDIALDVDHCLRSVGGDGPAHGARIQFPAVDSHHACGHWLRPAQGDSSQQGGAGRRRGRRACDHDGERWIVLAIGFVVSFIVAFGVVEWFLQWVRKHGFTVFAIYRIVIGIVLLIWGSTHRGAADGLLEMTSGCRRGLD